MERHIPIMSAVGKMIVVLFDYRAKWQNYKWFFLPNQTVALVFFFSFFSDWWKRFFIIWKRKKNYDRVLLSEFFFFLIYIPSSSSFFFFFFLFTWFEGTFFPFGNSRKVVLQSFIVQNKRRKRVSSSLSLIPFRFHLVHLLSSVFVENTTVSRVSPRADDFTLHSVSWDITLCWVES